MPQKVFLTGATGFVGHQLVEGLLRKNPDAELWLLIRKQGDQTPEQRLQRFLRVLSVKTAMDLKILQERVHLVNGDIERPNFGISEGEFNNLARKINRIYHAGASVYLELALEKARQMNVEGTRTALKLAEAAQNLGGLERFNHISTAYVAGRREGIIYENELDLGQTFNNSYEQVKLEAEKLVQSAMPRFPTTIFRPSMIMGDSKTGWTNSFNVLYAPIKLGYFGKLPYAPGCKKSRIDTVPIDFIADSLIHLSHLDKEVIGRTFHLTVGQGRAISVDELIAESRRYLEKWIDHYQLKNPRVIPKTIHPVIFRMFLGIASSLTWGMKKRFIQKLKTYSLYTLFYKEFNTDQVSALLEPAGITPPKLVDYLDVISKYCVETHFGTSDRPQDVA